MMSFSERTMERGIKEGTKRTSYKFILKMHKKGMPIEDIAEICDEFSEEQIKEIISNETI